MRVIPLDSRWGESPPIRPRWHGPPDGSLEKGDKRITPLVKQNLHYLCRRGSVRYARLCPADLNGARLGAANTIACIDHAADETQRSDRDIDRVIRV